MELSATHNEKQLMFIGLVLMAIGLMSLLNCYDLFTTSQMETVRAHVKPAELSMIWRDNNISSHTNATIANQTTVEAESAEPMTLMAEEETQPPAVATETPAPLFQE